jgi:small subunit ribosomal protein S9
MAEDEKRDSPEQPEEGQAPEERPAEEPAAEERPAEERPAEEPEEAAAEEPPAEEAPAEEPAAEEPARRRRKRDEKKKEEEVIPGAHLEPDLVLEEERREQARREQLAGVEFVEEEAPAVEEEPSEAAEEEPSAPQPVERRPIDLAADARYQATGKRKSAVARVILKPGGGEYTVNGRGLDEFFPRVRLQKVARQPLETAGYEARMDVVARIHGGGVSSQAGALRHGIARALVEADPALRLELKRRGFLTRDPRQKERKKAGLKKARKRPQFSKR